MMMNLFSSSQCKQLLLLSAKYLTRRRHLSTRVKCHLVASKLDSRSLVCVRGQDASAFLQGIITNDIGHLETKPAIYTLFLNHQGRVLYDAILYSTAKEGETWIECDLSLKPSLMKHLSLYRVRKKVEITDGTELGKNLWVIFDPAHKYVAQNYTSDLNCNNSNPGANRRIDYEVCCRPVVNHSSKRQELPLGKGIEGIGDPRLEELGWRVFLSSTNASTPHDLSKDIEIVPEKEYIKLRYCFGVGEGVHDLPPANCFPLESNGDYLHGVSFQKGCYIGQELTARTHHTGIVRKRLMPFRLVDESATVSPDLLKPDTQLIGKGGKKVGKVRGLENSYGLFLARIDDALNSPELKLDEHVVSVGKPLWWPIEASKESQASKK